MGASSPSMGASDPSLFYSQKTQYSIRPELLAPTTVISRSWKEQWTQRYWKAQLVSSM